MGNGGGTRQLGFNIYRSDSEAGQRLLVSANMIAGTGTGQGKAYSWQDADIESGPHILYWLEDVDYDGTLKMHGPVTLSMSEAQAAPVQLKRTGDGHCIHGACRETCSCRISRIPTDADRVAMLLDGRQIPAYSTARGRPMQDTRLLVFSTEGLVVTNITIGIVQDTALRMAQIYAAPETDRWRYFLLACR